MAVENKSKDDFDLKLAIECAQAFSVSTGLGCTVSSTLGENYFDIGYNCVGCEMCDVAGINKQNCSKVHMYGMTEAERFGGKYIYFCTMGLTCFVSPIVGQVGSEAKITVGPFLMVDEEDYVAFDLQQVHELDGEKLEKAKQILKKVPVVTPGNVNSLSILLFMSVNFMNDVSAANRMLDTQDSELIQGQVSAYILELKQSEPSAQYPFETEQELISSIASTDKPQAQKFLNELLGYIFFSSGGDISTIRTRVCELLTVISRVAIETGAPPEQTLQMNHEFFKKAYNTQAIDEICFSLTNVMNKFMDSVFLHVDIKHVDVIHKTVQYLRDNSSKKISIGDVARHVYLSPSYFSKIFKKEMGCSFNTYLNNIRIEKSKKLLLKDMRLADIATFVGFEDQSYFTKVFKRVMGISPNRFRELGPQSKR